MEVKVMYWNIQGGSKPEIVAELIAMHMPDLLGLSEIKFESNAGYPDSVSEIESHLRRMRITNLYRTESFPVFRSDRHPGNKAIGEATLIKISEDIWPVGISSFYQVLSGSYYGRYRANLKDYEGTPAAEFEPRGLIRTRFRTGRIDSKEHVFYSGHLAVNKNFQDSPNASNQLTRLSLAMMDSTTGSCIVAADLNLVPWDRELVKFMQRNFLKFTDPEEPENQKPSWPVGTLSVRKNIISGHYGRYGLKDLPEKRYNDQFRIDQIMVKEQMRVLDFQIIETEASDHAALIAVIDV